MNRKSRMIFSTKLANVQVKRKTFDATDKTPAKSVTTLTGYPILWGDLSSDRGGYAVRLAKDSAKFAAPTFALFNHQFGNVIGSTFNDTLRILPADDKGIPVEIDLPNTTVGNDTAELVAQGYISGMSFSMVNGFESYTESKENGQNILNCTAFSCDEVSIVPNPSFDNAAIAVKPEDDKVDTQADEDNDDSTPEPVLSSQPKQNNSIAMAKLNRLRLNNYSSRL